MHTLARSVLIATVLLAGCHKANNPPPPPPPPPAAADVATPPPPAPMPPPPRAEAMPVPPRPTAVPIPPAPQPITAGSGGGGGSRPPMHKTAHASVASAPSRGPASVPQPTAAPADPASQVHTWYQNLPKDWVRYEVEKRMTMGTDYTATATIPPVGSASAGAVTADPNKVQTIDKAIKVSNYMRVTLTAPANPDAFKIVPPSPDCKFVSQDGTTKWPFKVTPLHSGASQQLVFTTTVLSGSSAAAACDTNNPTTIDVTTDQETVRVDAIRLGETEHAIKDDAIQHPATYVGYIKYILPGGAIFTFIAGAIAWWKKRNAPTADEKKEKT